MASLSQITISAAIAFTTWKYTRTDGINFIRRDRHSEEKKEHRAPSKTELNKCKIEVGLARDNAISYQFPVSHSGRESK